MLRFFQKKAKPTGSVSILIPTMFDSRYIIELCIKSIGKYTEYPDYEIIVCDAGVDETTGEYLARLASSGIIKMITATDWKRPKDDLVRAVNTDYYVLMHDDIRIFKKNWLENRLRLMNRNVDNAIVGSVVKNYANNSVCRFFPLGMLVKTSVSRQLDLKWGKQPGFDTGCLAYIRFCEQNKYKFVHYKPSRDIYHFAEMTWPKYHTPESYSNLDQKLYEREKKIRTIQHMLEENAY